jgi:hypothetical protein
LEKAAGANGRSLTQEAEFRLERSFERHELLTDALELTWGPQLAGLILVIGGVLREYSASVSRYSLLKGVGDDWGHELDNWLGHPFVYDQAFKAIVEALEFLRPPGPAEPPDVVAAALIHAGWDDLGREIARDLLPLILEGRTEHTKRVLHDLGNLVPKKDRNK